MGVRVELGIPTRVTELKFIYLCGEDEITFGKAVNLVCPDGYLGPAPAKTDVWMMSLRFREIGDTANKHLGLTKIPKLV